MRNLFLLLALVASASYAAMGRHYTSGSSGLSVTNSSATQAPFTDTADGDGDADTTEEFLATTVVIHNGNASGGAACYYRLLVPGSQTGTATTTNGSRIEAASVRTEEYDGPAQGWIGIAHICGGSDTATFYVDAYE